MIAPRKAARSSSAAGRTCWHRSQRGRLVSQIAPQGDNDARYWSSLIVVFVNRTVEHFQFEPRVCGQTSDVTAAMNVAPALGQAVQRGDRYRVVIALIGKEREDEEPTIAQGGCSGVQYGSQVGKEIGRAVR